MGAGAGAVVALVFCVHVLIASAGVVVAAAPVTTILIHAPSTIACAICRNYTPETGEHQRNHTYWPCLAMPARGGQRPWSPPPGAG